MHSAAILVTPLLVCEVKSNKWHLLNLALMSVNFLQEFLFVYKEKKRRKKRNRIREHTHTSVYIPHLNNKRIIFMRFDYFWQNFPFYTFIPMSSVLCSFSLFLYLLLSCVAKINKDDCLKKKATSVVITRTQTASHLIKVSFGFYDDHICSNEMCNV